MIFEKRGIWSEEVLDKAWIIEPRNLDSQLSEIKVRSSLVKLGSILLLGQVQCPREMGR